MDNALREKWAFGFQNRINHGVHSLCDGNRNAIFYISSHSGVIYDYRNCTQTIIRGHSDLIKCCVVSKDKKFIITCDSGKESRIIIWDSRSGTPIKTIMNAHARGVDAVDISADGQLIVTIGISTTHRQEISIWAWTRKDKRLDCPDGRDKYANLPILTREVTEDTDYQHSVCFDRLNNFSMVSTGSNSVIFWNCEGNILDCCVCHVSKMEFSHLAGDFTSSQFLCGSNSVVTATSEGYIIVWEPINERTGGSAAEKELKSKKKVLKAASKVLKLVDSGITTMVATDSNYLALGCADGAIRFYDFSLRLESWFEDIAGGSITSLSFSSEINPHDSKDAGHPGAKFWVPNFIIGTANALIYDIDSILFHELNPENRKGNLLMQGFPCDVVDLKCHPSRPLVAFLCSDPGSLQIWDYSVQLLMTLRDFTSQKDSELFTSPQNAKQVRSLRSLAHGKAGNTEARRHLLPSCMAFETTLGDVLAVGFKSGEVRILRTDTLQDMMTFKHSADAVTSLKFSPSGIFLAGYDESHCTLLFRRVVEEVHTHNYTYIGRVKAHSSTITGMDFGYRDGVEILLSVGLDRRVCEYDLEGSSVEAGFLCQTRTSNEESKASRRDSLKSNNNKYASYDTLDEKNDHTPVSSTDITGRPTAIMWQPRMSEMDIEEKFFTVNTEYKMKEFNAHSKECRKTTLAPVFSDTQTTNFLNRANTLTSAHKCQKEFFSHFISGAPDRLIPIRINGWVTHYAYSCPDNIIGVGTFPLTGNPTQVMGISAHAGAISAISVSFDGKYLFSAGRGDQSSYMYQLCLGDDSGGGKTDSNNTSIHHSGVEGQPTDIVRTSGSLEPFLSLLEGGKGGDLHEDIIDYFYYCQLRAQGEDSMEERAVTGRIPVDEIPALMRAVGFYPSEAQVVNMLNEVRYQTFITTGLTEETIDLPGIITLYINHRPIAPLNNKEISDAFAAIARDTGCDEGALTWDSLQTLLCRAGESMTLNNIDNYLTSLLGVGEEKLDGITPFGYQSFAEDILGFES